MTSFGAILVLAFVCHLSVTFGRNYRKEYGEGSLFFPHHNRYGKPKTESGVRYVRPRPLEPFDSSDALEDADIEERQLLNLLRRIYEERELSESELNEDEGLFFSWY